MFFSLQVVREFSCEADREAMQAGHSQKIT